MLFRRQKKHKIIRDFGFFPGQEGEKRTSIREKGVFSRTGDAGGGLGMTERPWLFVPVF